MFWNLNLMIPIKACKFTAFPRTFQIINYLFFKEVYNPNIVRILSSKLQYVLKSMSFQRRHAGRRESMLFKTVLNRLPPIDSRLRTCPCWNDIEGRLVAQKKATEHSAALLSFCSVPVSCSWKQLDPAARCSSTRRRRRSRTGSVIRCGWVAVARSPYGKPPWFVIPTLRLQRMRGKRCNYLS